MENIINYNSASKAFVIAAIILSLMWISFFPEPLHQQYWILTEAFLGTFLFILALNNRRIKPVFSRADWPIWLFLLVTTGGIFSAQDKAVAIRTYLDLSLTLCFLYLLAKLVFSAGKNIKIVAKTICLFSTAVAVFALLEWVFRKNPIYEYFIDNPYYARYLSDYVRRPMATQLNPAVLGTYLLGCLPFSFLLIKDNSFFFRILALLSIILSPTVILLTLSRGVFLGLMALFLFYLIMKKNIRLLIVFLIILIVFLTACSYLNFTDFNRFSFRRLIFGSYDSVFSEYRIERLSMALKMLKDYPFFGVGWEHFRLRFNEYYPYAGIPRGAIPYEFMVADNMYLTILAETGIIGFVGFLIFIVYGLKRGIKGFYISQDRQKQKMLLVAGSALVGLLVNMGAYELFYWHNPFFLFCLFYAIISAQSY